VKTPIWDKAEARDVSAYDATPYRDALRALEKIMVTEGRGGYSAEHVGRCVVLMQETYRMHTAGTSPARRQAVHAADSVMPAGASCMR
jgi:hypothetical protein